LSILEVIEVDSTILRRMKKRLCYLLGDKNQIIFDLELNKDVIQ